MQSDQSKYQDPTLYRPQETHIKLKNTNRLRVKRRKKIYHVNSNFKKVVLKQDKVEFKNCYERLRHFIMPKGR